MQDVAAQNYRNLWRHAYHTYGQPYKVIALPPQLSLPWIQCDRLTAEGLWLPFPATEARSCAVPSYAREGPCAPGLPCLSQSSESGGSVGVPGDALVVHPYVQFSLHDVVTFSPAKLTNSQARCSSFSSVC